MAMLKDFPMTYTCVENAQPWVGFHQAMSPPLLVFSTKKKRTTKKCVGQALKAGFHVTFGRR
jgi:hypothetical protein